MAREFSRGQKAKISDLTPEVRLTVGLRAEAPGSPVFDISCFGLDAQGKLSDDRYFIFYNQPTSPEGSISQTGAQGGDLETFSLDLSRIPASIDRLVFTVTIDGAGTMRQVSQGHLRISAAGGEVARFPFQGGDFGEEKALMVGEMYRKDGWRFAAVGQGFAGGLDALLRHFGGEVAESAPATPVAAPAAAPATSPNLTKRVQLDKKIEQQAPGLVSLVKKAGLVLEKKGLSSHQAKVALVLDISGSMSSLYRSGKIQRLAEKVLALGTRFDDDGSIDIFLFGERAHDVGEMSIENFSNYVSQTLNRYQLEGGTYYGKAIRAVREHYFPGNRAGDLSSPSPAPMPVYVMFLTDGQTFDEDVCRRQLTAAAYEPIFWQFMGIGKSSKDVKAGGGGFWQRAMATDFAFLEALDNLAGRYVDNANFFSVEDPELVADDELYELLMAEYPGWVREAPAKGLIR